MEVSFRRIVRRFRRRVRNGLAFVRGGLYALSHLRETAKEMQDVHAKMIPEMQKYSEFIRGNDRNILFLLIGQALSAWATMEEALVVIFSTLLRVKPEQGGLIMYSIINFNVWLALIDELFVTDELLVSFKPRWNKLSARLRRIKDDRDRLAHHAVGSEQQKKPGDLVDTFLRAPSLDSRQKTQKFSPMDNDHIMEFTETVSEIAQELLALSKEMLAASREKYREPNPAQDQT